MGESSWGALASHLFQNENRVFLEQCVQKRHQFGMGRREKTEIKTKSLFLEPPLPQWPGCFGAAGVGVGRLNSGSGARLSLCHGALVRGNEATPNGRTVQGEFNRDKALCKRFEALRRCLGGCCPSQKDWELPSGELQHISAVITWLFPRLC